MIPSHGEESLREQVLRCQQGDDRAFESLVRRFDPDVRALVARLGVRDWDVEDITSDVWLNVWTGIPRFRFESQFSTWLYRITVNRVRDEQRRRNRRPSPVPLPMPHFEEEIDDDPTVEQIVFAWSEVRPALDALPADLREAVVLLDGQGLTGCEAAEILGVPDKTLYSRRSRGRSLLKALLSPIPEEPVT